MNRTASVLARSPFYQGAQSDEVSLSDQVVSLLESKDNYSANLDAVKVADEMQKSTLSMLA